LGPIEPPRNKVDVTAAVLAGKVSILDKPVWVIERFLVATWAAEDIKRKISDPSLPTLVSKVNLCPKAQAKPLPPA